VDADLEVLTARLVHMRAANDRVAVDPRRQRYRTFDLRLRTDHRLGDLARGLINHRVVVGLEPDPDPIIVFSHLCSLVPRSPYYVLRITYHVIRIT